MLSTARSRSSGKISGFWKYLLIVVFLILGSVDVIAQNGAWKKITQMPVQAVGASAAAIGSKIYVLGGMIPGDDNSKLNQVYDLTTGKWETRAPMTEGRSFLFTAVVDGIIYAIGGGYPAATNAVEAYDPAADKWTSKASMPSVRSGGQAAVVDGIIYVIGGAYNGRSCEAYDPKTNTWTKKADMPDAGGSVAVSVYNGQIYVFGGGFYGILAYYGPFETVFVYNPQNNTWTRKSNMPARKFAFQTYVVNDRIYAAGGCEGANSALSAVNVYNPLNDTWLKKTDMPFKSTFFAGAAVNGKIYVIGGTPDWQLGNGNVWEYDPQFNTAIAAGNVSGTWEKAKSPYYINGEITVPDNSTLTIEPGVDVFFTGHYKFNIQGRLISAGTKDDFIKFTAENEQTGWHGLRFINTPNSNEASSIQFSSFSYGKANTGDLTSWDRSGGAIMIRGFDKVSISNCTFEYNMTDGDMFKTGGPAIYISNASPSITGSTFRYNTGSSSGAIRCDSVSQAVISNNKMMYNTGNYGTILIANMKENTATVTNNIISYNKINLGGGGIFIYRSAKPMITNNLIVHNKASYGGGIYCQADAAPVFINNTIADNIAAIGNNLVCQDNSDPVFINTILHQEEGVPGNQIFIHDAESDPQFFYCNIQGGNEGFAGNGARSNHTGGYQSNITQNALLLTAPLNFYQLDGRSPCIGAGTDSMTIEGKWYYAPKFCIMGMARPTPAGSKPDLGACENLSGQPAGSILTDAERAMAGPKEFTLYQNYPNPFNPSTSISYSLPYSSFVTIKVFDLLGSEVATLVNEQKPAGSHNIIWNAENISNGVYFYRIKAGTYSATKKMILLR